MNSINLSEGVVALSHWALVRAQGADAQTFLQGQLTNDVTGLGPQTVRLAGFCSAKGRLQASFLVWRHAPDEFWLACSASLMPALLKRMSMFVLRAKCVLADITATHPVQGALGRSAAGWADSQAPWTHRQVDGATVLRLPDVRGVPRAVRIGAAVPPTQAQPQATLDAWRRLEVQSGIGWIVAETVDQFVPQMLNYELLGGVDFKKGCYPGQEVVARSQYRGSVKRRTLLFESDAALHPGQEVFDSAQPEQPAGQIVNAAPREDGTGSWALVEVKLDALAGAALHVGATQGAQLVRAELPYDVPTQLAPQA